MKYNGHHFRCVAELPQRKGNPRCHTLKDPGSEQSLSEGWGGKVRGGLRGTRGLRCGVTGKVGWAVVWEKLLLTKPEIA